MVIEELNYKLKHSDYNPELNKKVDIYAKNGLV